MLLSEAAAQVLRQTVPAPDKVSGMLAPAVKELSRDGRLTVAQVIALAVAARAMDGERGAVDALAKLAEGAPDGEADAPARTVIRVRLVDGQAQGERFDEWEDYCAVRTGGS